MQSAQLALSTADNSSNNVKPGSRLSKFAKNLTKTLHPPLLRGRLLIEEVTPIPQAIFHQFLRQLEAHSAHLSRGQIAELQITFNFVK